MSTIDLNDSHESNLSYTSDDFEEVNELGEFHQMLFISEENSSDLARRRHGCLVRII